MPNATTGCLLPLVFTNNFLNYSSITPGCNLTVTCYRESIGSIFLSNIKHLLLIASGFDAVPTLDAAKGYPNLIATYLNGRNRMVCGIDGNGLDFGNQTLRSHDQLTQGHFYNYLVEYLMNASSGSDPFFKNFVDDETKITIFGHSAGAFAAITAPAYKNYIHRVVVFDPVDCPFNLSLFLGAPSSSMPATETLINAISNAVVTDVYISIFAADDRVSMAEGKGFLGCLPYDMFGRFRNINLAGASPSGAYAEFHQYHGMGHESIQGHGSSYPPISSTEYFTVNVVNQIIAAILPTEMQYN